MRVHRIKRFTPWLAIALLAIPFFRLPSWAADSLTQVNDPSSQNANDSISWASLGGDGTVQSNSSFSINSAGGIGVSANLAAANSLTAIVCPGNPSCSWAGANTPPGFVGGDELLWTADAANGGNGPLTLTFSQGITGAGAWVQADAPGPFNVQVQAFNGASAVKSFTASSDQNGDPVYIGFNDTFGSNITSAIFSLSAPCPGVCADFAIDTVYLNTLAPSSSPSPTATPTPAPSVSATTTPTPTATPTPLPPGPPQITLGPRSIAFGNVNYAVAGSGNRLRRLTITNPARYKTTAIISSIAGTTGFTADPACNNAAIPAGGRLVCNITYTPTALGTVSGTLTIRDNVGGGSQTVGVSGGGTQGRLVAAPGTLGFGRVSVSTAVAKTVTLRNRSTATFTISSIGNGNQAFVSSQNCVGLLAPGASCTIAVTFTPTVAGLTSDTLQVTDGPDGIVRNVILRGTGQ